MKNLIVTLVMFIPTVFFGQKAFDKFDGREEITSVVVNKKTFEMLGSVKSEDKEVVKYMDLVDGIENFRMFSTSSINASKEMRSEFDSYRKKQNLEELLRVNDEGKTVQIYVRSGNSSSKIKELLLFIDGGDKKGDETVLISLLGNLDLKSLNGLTK